LQTARDSAQLLLEILNEILDFSRIEADRIELETTRFSLHKTVEQVVKTLGIRADEKGLNLTLETSDNVPDRVIGDPLRLQQVLMNLLNNAIKFTVEGRIELCVHAVNKSEGSPVAEAEAPAASFIILHFSVSDTGIGIARENLQKIFSPFTQADASTTRQFGGTGLGLAISRRLVEFMGGRLHIESEAGKGSTFSFEIPLHLDLSESDPAQVTAKSQVARGGLHSKDDRSSADANAPPRKLRVLLAEDTRANQKLVMHLLGKRGHVVELAENGRQALQLLSAADYDVVLMDVQMPELDGFQATAEIRQMSDRNKACVPIIALTAYAMKGDREQCLAAGMDGYLTKPISRQALLEAVEYAAPHLA